MKLNNILALNAHIEDDLDIECEDHDYQPINNDPDPVFDYDSPYISDLVTLAKHHIRTFFQGKNLYCGGPVPRHQITNDFYVAQILNTTLEEGVQAVYDAWHTAALGVVTLKQVRAAVRSGRVPTDVESVLTLMHEFEALRIPKCFRGGILMMYFEFCEGFNYESAKANISVGVA